MILADTDVLIDYLAGVPTVTARMESYLAKDQLSTTIINCFELLSGARDGDRGDRIRSLARILPALPLAREEAARAAIVRRQLESEGQSIGMADSLIAGIALTYGLPLWTRNRRHFERVPGLQLANEP